MRKNMCRIIFLRCRKISPRRDVVFVQNFFCPALLKVCPILLGKFFKNMQKSEKVSHRTHGKTQNLLRMFFGHKNIFFSRTEFLHGLARIFTYFLSH